MAQYRKIEYLIGKDGKITERVIDGNGSDCIEATSAIEASLGKVDKRNFLPEYYQESAIAEIESIVTDSI